METKTNKVKDLADDLKDKNWENFLEDKKSIIQRDRLKKKKERFFYGGKMQDSRSYQIRVPGEKNYDDE